VRRVAFHTLGCKVNQYDTQAMHEALAENYKIVAGDQQADIHIVNTCTVTSRADQKARQEIRSIIRYNPDAFVAVTGCYVQKFADVVAKIRGVDLIFGNSEKNRITTFLTNPKKAPRPAIFVDDVDSCTRYDTPSVTKHQSHCRAFVKIQDGCRNYCSYCIVPYVRGPKRSRFPKNILEEIKQLIANGYKEIVLTGVCLGAWGQDLEDGPTLAGLLEEIHKIEGLVRIRLSSIEPRDFTKELIDTITHLPKVCRHLHIPLQSGDDRILEAMNRNYGTFYYAKLLERIRKSSPEMAITTDILVGFPGEGPTEFQHTYHFARRMKFSKMHVFRFSPRPGTAAAPLKGKVRRQDMKTRSEQLLKLSLAMQEGYNKNFLGRLVKILVEERRPDKYLSGLTDNYIRVILPGPEKLINTLSQVKINRVNNRYVLGEL
jgi:threonylcarbamoyladenosine tRNA methylthiotransferase MtaB